ncbi:MAG: hypothetical protein ACJA1L_003343 [Paracoccaceae bacterium]|jgi:hypothetical protein
MGIGSLSIAAAQGEARPSQLQYKMGSGLFTVKKERSAMMPRQRDNAAGVAIVRQAQGIWARATRAAALIAVLCVAALARTPAMAADLSGGYFGIAEARGMRIEVDQGAEAEAPAGRFIDSNGVAATFGGGWVEGGIEAILSFPKRAVFMRLMDAPSGLVMIALPFDENAQPIAAQSRRMVFVRDSLAAPSQPEMYQPEPQTADRVVDPDVFLASYGFWTPDGVSRGFNAIGARYRTMLRLFPMVHADILWSLCRAPGKLASTQRGEALRAQGVDCDEILATVEKLQRNGGFDDWKSAAAAEGAAAMESIQCARGFIVKQSVCGPASQRTAKAAVSMATVASAIARFR